MLDFRLGTLAASEALLKDLYVDLRKKVNAWSEITNQTPQARMGYVGQHLVSVVTGYLGGKSGARGYDLIMEDGSYGEIKTCYRVDQLGSCNECGSVVSSLETFCAVCGSSSINRRDDSKWLINIRNDSEFEQVIKPFKYYFVLFEFEEIDNVTNNNIVASIWEVNPKAKGFAYCMIDYYLNIRAHSISKAPFNMWPHNFKFALTNPKLIYQSLIKSDGLIETKIFPTLGNARIELLRPLPTYYHASTITLSVIKNVIHHFSPTTSTSSKNKRECLEIMERLRIAMDIENSELCEVLAEKIYMPLIFPHKNSIPDSYKSIFTELV